MIRLTDARTGQVVWVNFCHVVSMTERAEGTLIVFSTGGDPRDVRESIGIIINELKIWNNQ